MLRAIPEVGATLPPNAVGRDFRPWPYVGLTDSGTGVEASLWGVLGVKLGWVEGVEVNVLGLVAGLDLRNPGVKLPGFGRIGLDHHERDRGDRSVAFTPICTAAEGDGGSPGSAKFAAMHDTLPLLETIPFPAIRRGRLDTLQVNVGYRCNQSCVHCHVGASPHRTEEMNGEVVDTVLEFLERRRIADARHHRRRARAQSAFPPPGDRGARPWACG